MAIFGMFGKSGSGDKPGDKSAESPKGAGDGMDFSPEKAKKFFDRARSVHDTGQYEYAMSLWLQGLRFEPSNIDAVRAFFASSDQLRAAGTAKVSKETLSAVAGSTPVHKYLATMLDWAQRINEPDAAVRCIEAITALKIRELVRLLGPSALGVCAKAQRLRKAWFVNLMECFVKAECNDLAVQAGEIGCRLDPADTRLATDVRNLSAQATMDKGGYENTGSEGGFRSNIKDAEKQRLLNEERGMLRSEDGQQRALLAAKADYEANPKDKPTIAKYLKTLMDRGTPTDDVTAIEVAEKAYAETQEFRWRKVAGEIPLRRGRIELKALKAAMEKNPQDAAAREAFLKAEQTQLELEIKELSLQVEAYPTDLPLKFELGKRFLLNKQFDQAIEQLQKAKADMKQQADVSVYLGRAFQAIGWQADATEIYRGALDQHADANDPVGMELRYGLLVSLQTQAEETRDLNLAQEGDKIAAAITIQQFSFKDVRQRREQLKALIAQLRQSSGGTPSAGA